MTVTEECKRTSKLFPVSEAKQSLRGTTGMRFSRGAENEVGGLLGTLCGRCRQRKLQLKRQFKRQNRN